MARLTPFWVFAAQPLVTSTARSYYTAEKSGNTYDFNTASRLNELLVRLLIATGQLEFLSILISASFPKWMDVEI